MASLSALRSISRFPPALTGTVSPSGVRALKEAPEAAAAARRGESASHAATNSTTRLLDASALLDATSAEDDGDGAAPFFRPARGFCPEPLARSPDDAWPPSSIPSPSLAPSPAVARVLAS